MNKKWKDLSIILVLITIIFLIIILNMMGLVSGIKSKEDYDASKIENSIEEAYGEQVDLVNRYALDEVVYVYLSNENFYYVNKEGVLFLKEERSLFDDEYWLQRIEDENMGDGSIYFSYYQDQSVVVFENDLYIKVYDLKLKTEYFSFMKRGIE